MDGTIPLNDPQTTLALLSLDAVVGVKGQVSKGADGKLHLDRVGITCALCHSTVSRDLQITAPGLAGAKTDLAGIVGNRLDGWPNRDLQPGTIISLSPALTAGQKAEYASWAKLFGPGFYDPRINVNTDPGSNPAVSPDIDANIAAYKAAGGIPVVIPPAFGLVGLDKAIFTGDGDTAHEPAGPVSYWNRYVGVVQMHGHGTFSDERLIINGQPLKRGSPRGRRSHHRHLASTGGLPMVHRGANAWPRTERSGALRLTSIPRQSPAARPCSKAKQNARPVTAGRRSPM